MNGIPNWRIMASDAGIKNKKKAASAFSVALGIIANIIYNLIADIALIERYAFLLSLLSGLIIGSIISILAIYYRDSDFEELKSNLNYEDYLINIFFLSYILIMAGGTLYILISFATFVENALSTIYLEIFEQPPPAPIIEFFSEGHIWLFILFVILLWLARDPRKPIVPKKVKILIYSCGIIGIPAIFFYRNIVLVPYLGDYTPLFWIITAILVLSVIMFELKNRLEFL